MDKIFPRVDITLLYTLIFWVVSDMTNDYGIMIPDNPAAYRGILLGSFTAMVLPIVGYTVLYADGKPRITIENVLVGLYYTMLGSLFLITALRVDHDLLFSMSDRLPPATNYMVNFMGIFSAIMVTQILLICFVNVINFGSNLVRDFLANALGLNEKRKRQPAWTMEVYGSDEFVKEVQQTFDGYDDIDIKKGTERD